MRAKFGRGPTVVSKKGSLKFMSRLFTVIALRGLTAVTPQSQTFRVATPKGEPRAKCRQLVSGQHFSTYIIIEFRRIVCSLSF